MILLIFAWQATDFLELKSIDAKEIIRDHDVLYIYHNVIDATGDSAKTEEKVFEACLGPLKLCHYLLTKGVTENGTETVFG